MLGIRFLVLPVILTVVCHAHRVTRMVQSVAVSGMFVCGQRPAVGVLIKLFEFDGNLRNAFSSEFVDSTGYLKVPNHDDVLNETHTDHEGRFFVHGTALEVGQIEPIVKVYHDCLHSGLPGKRKIHFIVPPHFTNYGTHAEKVLDLGIFNLEAILP
ncbi:unnamed protein product, partial [Gongylonema pulchrum]|uniref:Transthyretin-like family protein n=1 Tax=Gongylonema pulchrum TaxID=637853 RepID=A0A183D9V1_9BILA